VLYKADNPEFGGKTSIVDFSTNYGQPPSEIHYARYNSGTIVYDGTYFIYFNGITLDETPDTVYLYFWKSENLDTGWTFVEKQYKKDATATYPNNDLRYWDYYAFNSTHYVFIMQLPHQISHLLVASHLRLTVQQ